MRISYIVSVLDSFDVVRKQLILLSNILYKYENDFEFILIDDGSNPLMIDKIFDFKNECFDSLEIVNEEHSDKWCSDIFTIEGLGFPFRIVETYDKRPWTQPRGRNIGADIACGEWLLMTDIDHIISEEGLEDSYNFNGD
ncbi:MAG: glycosyltransferase family 2 protein, partial [Methanothrix sp.]|nr:glycosyltransferase family 2 protein [Methanothrix sp.]